MQKRVKPVGRQQMCRQGLPSTTNNSDLPNMLSQSCEMSVLSVDNAYSDDTAFKLVSTQNIYGFFCLFVFADIFHVSYLSFCHLISEYCHDTFCSLFFFQVLLTTLSIIFENYGGSQSGKNGLLYCGVHVFYLWM